MKLSNKFLLLIVGSIVIPIVVFLLVFILIQITVGSSDPGNSMIFIAARILSGFRRMDRRESALEDVPDLFHRISPGIQITVIDADRNIRYSSMDGLTMTELAVSDRNSLGYVIHWSGFVSREGEKFAVFVSYSGGTYDAASWRILAVFGFFGSLLVFTTIMSVFIIRSINASIATLEVATRRISDGDLDFELPLGGSDSIASLTRSFNTMRWRVREETAARSRFIMSVSHDLKTPLSSIIGYLDAIDDNLAVHPDEILRYLAIIRNKTGVLESRIRQLIEYIKLETSDWERRNRELPFAAFLDETLEIFRDEAEVHGLRLVGHFDIDPELNLSMDEELVFRALENLVHNAFRHASPGSKISFGGEQSDNRVFIRIGNRGDDINESDIPFVFEPFYRGSKARNGPGFGLGLSVVKSVLASHGWNIELTSQNGETWFTIVISIGGAAKTAPGIHRSVGYRPPG